jgi:hypothetical protein
MAFAKPEITAARARLSIGLPLFDRGQANKPTNGLDSFDPKDGGQIFANSLLPMRQFAKRHRVMILVKRITIQVGDDAPFHER